MQSSLILGPLTLTFQRTLRVPDKSATGGANELPAGLGTFPLLQAGELGERKPAEWHPESYVLPMYSREALWINFRATTPVALTIGAGKVNAVTGKVIEAKLSNDLANPQSYLVAPPQPWIDGFKGTDGSVRQFVAVKLGGGETVEEQVTGKAEFGGIQFGLHLPKIDLLLLNRPREFPTAGYGSLELAGSVTRSMSFSPRSMGLGGGGQIKQRIYPDPYVKHGGKSVADVWHEQPKDKAFVHIVHALDWKALTGNDAPPTPITYKTYQSKGIPWFDLYDDKLGDVQGSDALQKLKPVGGAPNPLFAEDEKGTPKKETADVW